MLATDRLQQESAKTSNPRTSPSPTSQSESASNGSSLHQISRPNSSRRPLSPKRDTAPTSKSTRRRTSTEITMSTLSSSNKRMPAWMKSVRDWKNNPVSPGAQVVQNKTKPSTPSSLCLRQGVEGQIPLAPWLHNRPPVITHPPPYRAAENP